MSKQYLHMKYLRMIILVKKKEESKRRKRMSNIHVHECVDLNGTNVVLVSWIPQHSDVKKRMEELDSIVCTYKVTDVTWTAPGLKNLYNTDYERQSFWMEYALSRKVHANLQWCRVKFTTSTAEDCPAPMPVSHRGKRPRDACLLAKMRKIDPTCEVPSLTWWTHKKTRSKTHLDLGSLYR